MHIDDENVDIGRCTLSTAKSYKKKRRGEAEKKKRGKREMTTIETFDFVAKRSYADEREMPIASFTSGGF